MRTLAVIWAIAGRTDVAKGSGDILFAIEGRSVVEVLPPIQVRPLPAVATWVRGLATVRGASIAIVDVRRLLGFEARTPSSRNRIIVVPMPEPHGRRHLGLWVDAVIDVRQVDFGAPEAHPGVAPCTGPSEDGHHLLAADLLGPLGPTPWGLAQLVQPRQLFDDAGWSAIASRLEEVPT